MLNIFERITSQLVSELVFLDLFSSSMKTMKAKSTPKSFRVKTSSVVEIIRCTAKIRDSITLLF